MPSLLDAWGRAWDWMAGQPVPPSVPTPLPRPDFAPRYDAIYAELDPSELHQEDAELDDAALAEDLFRVDGRDQRILGYYSETGAREALERYGFFDMLREKGFEPVLVGDTSDPDEHRLRIYDTTECTDNILIELVVGVRPVELPNRQGCRFLFVNWLLMQDPHARFDPDRAPLPEQDHPGLGVFIHFAYLLKLISDRIGCDGLLNHPSHPHNGVLYGKVCHFIDPVIEGRFRALERDLGTHDLTALTANIEAGRVVDRDGVPFRWQPAPQVLPVSRRARRWFRSETYRDTMQSTRDNVEFHQVASEASTTQSSPDDS